MNEIDDNAFIFKGKWQSFSIMNGFLLRWWCRFCALLLIVTMNGLVSAEIIDDQPIEQERAEKPTQRRSIPTLWIVGDSTVRCGTPGQRGWGEEMGIHFDAQKIQVQNRAIGGRSSRTFLTEGKWDAVLRELKAGDWVLMQFGHNDASPINEDPPVNAATRARGTIRSNGDETQDIINILTGKPETVHSYGWYLRHFVTTAKERGAHAIILSPVPRLVWTKEKTMQRSADSWSLWAKQAAAQSGAYFLDLNDRLASRYEQLGPDLVKPLFADGTHTTAAGAILSAEVVVDGLRELSLAPLVETILPQKR